ncbi:MAG: hypothetical protein PWP23_2645 [Candidatus Sumerlaeota bacterium]|nr:hypothetical protein [Candidatus Sumerlaeota bacterium]
MHVLRNRWAFGLKTAFAVLVAILLLAPGNARAQTLSADPADRLSTVPHDEELQAALLDTGIGMIAVRHEGWNETLDSWARIKMYEITGRTSIHGQDPVYSVLSIMYRPDQWIHARILPVEHPRIAEIMQFDGKWVSLADIFDNPNGPALGAALDEVAARREEFTNLQKLLDAVHQARSIGENRPGIAGSMAEQFGVDPARVQQLMASAEERKAEQERLAELGRQVKHDKPFLRAGSHLQERAELLTTLDRQFFIVPDADTPDIEWITPLHAQLATPSGTRIVPASNSTAPAGGLDLPAAAVALDGALVAAFRSGEANGLNEAVAGFLRTVEQSRYYPSHAYLAVKNFYVNFAPSRTASWFYLLATVLFGLFTFFRKDGWRLAGTGVLLLALAWQTLGLALRLSLTGHMPVSNMYESIVFTSWAAIALGAGLELWKRNGMFGLVTAVIGTIALIGVSLMPLHETRIHPLRAVLNSYWLNIHVTFMLISYGAFAVSAFFAAGYLVKHFARRDALFGNSPLMPKGQMEEFAYRLVQIGWPILTVGICLGAIWADTAWGRFWGWDPKETWALITWIAYTIYLHTRMVMGWKGHVSAMACLAGFVMVLITWLGVSYLPGFAGGLHTYASPT